MNIHHHRTAAIAASLAGLGSLASCVAEDELGFDDLVEDHELRMAMVASPDPLPQAALDTIDATLPEGQDATAAHPELFPTGFDPNPDVVSANTDVWVTFAREGSSYDSVMGFFTYPSGNPPASLTAQELEDGVIMSGTEGRTNGERWHLGTFQPGVRVGFYLVRGGACTSGANCNTTVGADFTQPIFFSVDSMNPEHATAPSVARHVIMGDLVDDLAPDARVLAWEEKERNSGFSDDDFNDLVVRVTATPALGGDAPPPVGGGQMGNGVLEGAEQCDDGNLDDGDGCDSTGAIEPGWQCSGEPSTCSAIPPSGPADFIVFRPNTHGPMIAECGYDHGGSEYVCGEVPASEIHNPTDVLTGDVNADGETDVIQYGNDGWNTIPTCFGQEPGYSCSNIPWNKGPYPAGAMAAIGDFNSDGRDDVTMFNTSWTSLPTCHLNGTNDLWDCNNYMISCNGGDCPNPVAANIHPASHVLGANTIGSTYRDEFIQYNHSWTTIPTCELTTGSNPWICRNLPASCNPAVNGPCGSYGSGIQPNTEFVVAGDFDGDGDDEIAQFNDAWASIPVCFFDEWSQSYACDNTDAPGGFYDGVDNVIAQDINGDGCDDIVMVGDTWSSYPTCYSPCVSSGTWLGGSAQWQCFNEPSSCLGADCGNMGTGVWPNVSVNSGH